MEGKNKTDNDFKRDFNLGYELAKELNLKTSLFSDEKKPSSNAIHAGMLQFIEENTVSRNKNNLKSNLVINKYPTHKKSEISKDKGLSK